MARLSPRDLGQALDFLREAERVDGPDPFPCELLDSLRELVGCDYVNYSELDRPNERSLLQEGCARAREVNASLLSDEVACTFWRLRHQHPVCAYQDRTGDFGARKLSDFLTHKQLHGLELYDEFLQPFGVEYELDVGLPAPPTHTKVFLFSRHGRDFTERDRLLLEVLRPHLASFYDAARDRRVLTAFRNHEDSTGLVVVGRGGVVDFAGSRARELLRLYFQADTEQGLPEVLHDWMRQEVSLTRPGLPLVVTRGGWRLIVRRLDDVLLLREEAANLTRRENEVLGLVAEGHTNAEIAARLWLSAGTVRIHLQHIYEKLGVRNRTAAAAHARRGART